jgi:hypothetical protein
MFRFKVENVKAFNAETQRRGENQKDLGLNQIIESYSLQLAALFNFKETTFVWLQ